ncbi:protein-disulfide reductase DsbD domain-containing protein [Palleronia caenipelagi]|nr:protein-disulfide reductase DsbD domain-containing protein [Palleronia caenipelagi]
MIRRLAIILIAAIAAPAAFAADIAQIRVLPGWRQSDTHHMAALEIRLAPGWKTYWRIPGEAGIAPSFDWSRSENVGAFRVHWPTPDRFGTKGLRYFGYQDTVVLPVEITPRRAGEPITLDVDLDIGVCKDVCVPVQATVGAALLATSTRPDARIRLSLADQPVPGNRAGVRSSRCRIEMRDGSPVLTAQIDLPAQGRDEDVLFESHQPGVALAGRSAVREGGILHAEARIRTRDGDPAFLERGSVGLVVLGDDQAVTIPHCG